MGGACCGVERGEEKWGGWGVESEVGVKECFEVKSVLWDEGRMT